METYLSGLQTSTNIPFVDESGNTIVATSAAYRVVDELENDVVAQTAVSITAGTPQLVTVVVSGVINTLAAGAIRGLRVIHLYLTTTAGTVKLEVPYLLEAEQVLVIATNSFQTYAQALLVSVDIPDLYGWDAATKQSRVMAMSEAWRRVGQLRFRYIFDTYQNIIDNTLVVADLTLATLVQYNSMPEEFKAALRRAQILEANYILGSDEIGELRLQGVISMTIGESSQFFRDSKPLVKPVCDRALSQLGKYVLNRHRISRT